MYWQDEGLTAFLGRTVLQHGVPMAWDGYNLAHDLNYTRLYNDHFIWVGHPWLPFYMAAVGIGIAGPGPWGGRLPFALSGWLALALLYPAGRTILRSQRAALWSVATGVTSIPFYLYARQSQYYPLLMLGAVLTWWGLAATPAVRWRGPLLIVAGLLILAHSNPVSMCGALPACILTALAHWRRPRIVARYLVAGVAAATLVFPFLVYAESWSALQKYQGTQMPLSVRAPLQFWRFLWEANLWLFPLAATPLVAWAGRWLPRRSDEPYLPAPEAVRRLGRDLLFGLAVISVLSPWPFIRYALPLLPLAWLLMGAVLARTQDRYGAWAFVLAVTLLATRAWSAAGHRIAAAALDHVNPGGMARAGLARLEPSATRWRSDHGAFVHELTHDYRGPVDALVDFFVDRARPGQTIAITYPQEPIAVMTGLHLVARIPADWPEAKRLPPYVSTFGVPDWIVVRAQYPNTLFDADAFFRRYEAEYRRHDLGVPDVTWNNRPYPLAHHFHSPTVGPPLIVYERVPSDS